MNVEVYNLEHYTIRGCTYFGYCTHFKNVPIVARLCQIFI